MSVEFKLSLIVVPLFFGCMYGILEFVENSYKCDSVNVLQIVDIGDVTDSGGRYVKFSNGDVDLIWGAFKGDKYVKCESSVFIKDKYERVN